MNAENFQELTDWLRDGGWRAWELNPPKLGNYEVIEYLRRDRDGWTDVEPTPAKLADLFHPHNAAWNVANLFWRPVM